MKTLMFTINHDLTISYIIFSSPLFPNIPQPIQPPDFTSHFSLKKSIFDGGLLWGKHHLPLAPPSLQYQSFSFNRLCFVFADKHFGLTYEKACQLSISSNIPIDVHLNVWVLSQIIFIIFFTTLSLTKPGAINMSCLLKPRATDCRQQHQFPLAPLIPQDNSNLLNSITRQHVFPRSLSSLQPIFIPSEALTLTAFLAFNSVRNGTQKSTLNHQKLILFSFPILFQKNSCPVVSVLSFVSLLFSIGFVSLSSNLTLLLFSADTLQTPKSLSPSLSPLVVFSVSQLSFFKISIYSQGLFFLSLIVFFFSSNLFFLVLVFFIVSNKNQFIGFICAHLGLYSNHFTPKFTSLDLSML
ncbi:hypothetical protein VP01_4028g1 [Puccinia sorghi]|uniref:Uncharacterized protein n=1 Tax=Puccinia sorghi TaxID=27349 RepID=A0A0L6URU9_9BASI|nr:hypothetical protein VP01_4028g1 [Puccinia sorghi]